MPLALVEAKKALRDARVDQLLRAYWAKRVLFQADRIALVNQAIKAFTDFLPETSPVNLVKGKQTQGRMNSLVRRRLTNC